MLKPPECKVLARAFSEGARAWQHSTRLWAAQVPGCLSTDACPQLRPPVLRWVIHRARLIRPSTEQHCLLQASGVCLVVARAVISRREEERRTTAEGMERHMAKRPTSTLPAVRMLRTEAHLVALLRSLRARERLPGSNSLRLSTSAE